MSTTTHRNPNPVDRPAHFDHDDEELWDEKIEALLAANDIEAARAEFERQSLVSLKPGDPILMTPEKWEELRAELLRYSSGVDHEERESSAETGVGQCDEPRSGRPGHTVDALLDQGNIAGAKAELGRLLLQGMTSVDPVEATPEFFEAARDTVRRKAEQFETKKPA